MYDQNGQRRRVVQKTKPAMSPFAVFVTVFIVVVFIAASFCAGYYVGSNFKLDLKTGSIEKQENKNSGDDSKVTDYKVTDPKVAHLIENLSKGTESDCWAIEDFVNDRKITAGDISNTRAWSVAEMNNYYTSGIEEIQEKSARQEVRKYFGQDYQFVPSLVKRELNPCSRYRYDEKAKAFLNVGEDGACEAAHCQEYTTQYKMVKATDINGNLEIDVKVLFAGRGTNKYYKDYARTDIVTEGDEVDLAIIKGSDYKFKFKLVDGKYIFISSEPVK